MAKVTKKITDFFKEQARDRWFWICVASVTFFPVLIAFLLRGAPGGYDIGEHIRFAAAYRDAILNGSMMPVWSAADAYGFGSVGIRLYPPLADYLLAVTQIFTGDWYATFWLNTFFWTFPGCIGIYLWVSEYTPGTYAAAAAALYAVMPYHLEQLYQFQLYSEFAASAILPFCFLFATRSVRRGNPVDIVALSLSSALLVLTHIPSTIIGFACLGLYVAVIMDWSRPGKVIARLALAAALAIAATAFYLVRLVTEVDWVKHSTPEFSSDFYDYRRHLFPIIANFGDRYWLRSMSLIDLTIVATSLAFLPLVIWLFLRDRSDEAREFERRVLIAVLVTGAFSIFMLSGLSRLVWEAIPPLQKIQFPWRFLSVTTLAGTLGFAVACFELIGRARRIRAIVVLPVMLSVAGLVFVDYSQTFQAAEPLTREEFYNAVINKPEDSFCTCWRPVWAKDGAIANRERVSADGRAVSVSLWAPAERRFVLEAGPPLEARVATFYYPYWKAEVNGRQAEVSKDENGAIVFSIPAARSEVRLYFEEPLLDRIALFVSLAAWIAMAGWLAILAIKYLI